MLIFVNIEINIPYFTMSSRPTHSGNQTLHLSRIHDTEINLINGEVILEIELELKPVSYTHLRAHET